MKDWKKTLIFPSSPIIDAIKIIDKGGLQIALVVDQDMKLVGTVTDGDIRKGILRGVSLQEPVTQVMWNTPTVARIDDEPANILEMMKKADILQVPLLNDREQVVGLEVLKELIRKPKHDNGVVIMAGGMGKRLSPLTDSCPKPMIKIGEKPILETIIANFINFGFSHFYLSVNYMAEMIEEHFSDGSKWGVCIEYLREKKRMGTAGALSLLPKRPEKPFFVMNGDLLTKVNFKHLLNFHHEQNSTATMCVKEYDFQVPYGVITVDKQQMVDIDEKPVHKFFVNAGIYLLNPEIIDYIPDNTFIDMTSVFEKLLEDNRTTAVFPIREYWIDVGHLDDFKRANGEYPEQFLKTTDE